MPLVARSVGVEELDALDLVAEAVVLVDGDGRIRHVNDRAATLLGLSEDALGATLAGLLDLRDVSGRRWDPGADRPALGHRLPERVVYAQVRGAARPVAVVGRWSARGLVLTARSAGRRERLDAVRGDVVATVSHEIRSPLTSVKGFTRTMLAKWERFSDEQKRAMLETIDADADRVTRLLGELLDVSRIDAGRVQLHRQPLAVEDVARRVVGRLHNSELADGRALEVEAVEGLPQVHADPDKIEQVLTNLVENALRYAPDGPVRLTVDREADDVTVAVTDQGPGIDEDEHALVFQKFGRGRHSRGEGTGLGLYITRGLVDAHGGRVWIEADGRRGVSVRVSLPAGDRR